MSNAPKYLAAMGDSLTHAYTLGTPPHLYWPDLLAAKLNALGCNVRARNFAKSGHTTAQMVTRFPLMTRFGDPDLGILCGGANDSVPATTIQPNLQIMIKWLKFGCSGTAATPSALPSGLRAGIRYVVQTDASSTGGAAAAGGQTARIAGAGANDITVWECRNGLAGEYGWGRIAITGTPADRCSRIIVCGRNYLNYNGGGGDTPSTPEATNLVIRQAQAAAALAEGVPFCDLYNYLRARIVAGIDPDFSVVAFDQTRSWHYANANQHWSLYGWHLHAEAVLETVQAQAGWIEALK